MNKISDPVMRFNVSQSFVDFGFELRCGLQHQDGKRSVARPAYFEDVELDTRMPEMMHLTKDQATGLMDALWAAGVRPSNGEGNVGQIGAMKAHLEDMRTLVFNARGLPK